MLVTQSNVTQINSIFRKVNRAPSTRGVGVLSLGGGGPSTRGVGVLPLEGGVLRYKKTPKAKQSVQWL
jgi:hypothetical protein